MKYLSSKLNSALLLTSLLLFGGCASSLAYQKAADQGYPGYYDKALDNPGSFQIDFVTEDRNLAYAKYAAYYRAAELAYETGYRYFLPLQAYDLTKRGKAWGDPKNPSSITPGVRIIIQCYKEKPVKPVYDAYQYLSTAKVPGSDEIYSAAMRKGDGSSGAVLPK